MTDEARKLTEYEHRITELRAALRWIREAARITEEAALAGSLVSADVGTKMLTRIQQHAVLALLHDQGLERQQ